MGARLFVLVFGGLGALFLIIAVVAFTAGQRAAAERSDRLAAFRPVTAAGLSDSPPGRSVYAEGTLSPLMPARFGDLVAYERRRSTEYTDSDGETQISVEVVASELPPLRLDLPDGQVEVAGAYQLGEPARRLPEGGDEYVGFAAGDRVLVVGVTAAGEAGPRIASAVVTAQRWAEYRERLRAGDGAHAILTLVFGILGAFFLGFGVTFHFAFRDMPP